MRKTLMAGEGASVYLLSICVGSVLSLFLSLILSRSDASFDGMSAYAWSGYALMQVAFIGTVLVFCKVRRADVEAICRFKKPFSPWQLLFTPFLAIAAIMIFLPLANLWTAFLSLIKFDGGVATPMSSSVGAYFLALVVMAIVPAIGEEFLMRGAVFGALSTRNTAFGIVMSALFFSLMHANPLQTVHQFGLGLFLALTVALTGSVWCAMLVHFFNNFISLTVTAYIPQVDEAIVKLGYFNWLTGAASIVVGVFLAAILFYAMYKLAHREESPSFPRIEYEGFSLYVPASKVKQNYVKDFFKFFASLFTKAGWKDVASKLQSSNGVELISAKGCYGVDEKELPAYRRPLFGVWIALAFVAVYWFIAFVRGLV